MSALDKAFLQAHKKERAAESARAAMPVPRVPTAKSITLRPFTSASITILNKGAASKQSSTDNERSSPTAPATVTIKSPTEEQTPLNATQEMPRTVDRDLLTAADGSWIRIDSGASPGIANISSPHIYFATTSIPNPLLSLSVAPKPSESSATQSPQTLLATSNARIDAHLGRAVPAPHFRRGPVSGGEFGTASPPEIPAVDSLGSPRRPEATPFSSPEAVTVVDAVSPASLVATAGEAELSESHEAMINASKATKPRLPAVWEVDAFLWSEFYDRALSAGFDYFREAGMELHKATRGGLQMMTITSTQRSEGRTTIALCLARTVASTGVRVALVDADLDNPQLAANLGVQPCCGWENVVRGELPLAEAAVYSLEDRITLFPLADDLEKRNFSLSDPRVTKAIKKLKEHFDLVMIDMGPAGAADRRLFAGGELCPIDAALVVRDVRLTSKEEACATAAVLKANGVRSVGIVENFV